MQVERQAVGDVDHGRAPRAPCRLALGAGGPAGGGRRVPRPGAGAGSRRSPRRRPAAGPGDQERVAGPAARPRDTGAALGNGPDHGHRHDQLAGADRSPPTTGQPLRPTPRRRPRMTPSANSPFARAARHAQGDECPVGDAPMAARSLTAPMSAFQPTSAGLQSVEVDVDPLDHAVGRGDNGAAVRAPRPRAASSREAERPRFRFRGSPE